MGASSAIEWTDATWNPTTGCTRVSEGCRGCYAFQLHDQRHKAFKAGKEVPAQYAKPFTELQMFEDRLTDPLGWKNPRRVFVNSMSDLFHKDVPDEFIDRVFAVMKATPRHTYQILTKRPERMRAYMDPNTRASHLKVSLSLGTMGESLLRATAEAAKLAAAATGDPDGYRDRGDFACVWPLPNVWLGVSVEHQAAADERIPLLLQTPAAVRFLSCEPLLGPVDLSEYIRSPHGCDGASPNPDCEVCRGALLGVDWVIVGGESGPGSRPCHVEWVRDVVQQCQGPGDVGPRVFVKQLGDQPTLGYYDELRSEWEDVLGADNLDPIGHAIPRDGQPPLDARVRLPLSKKGGDPEEWPEDLQVREFPEPAHA